MAYPMAGPPVPKQRPGVVTAAGYLLYLVAVLLLLNMVISASVLSSELTTLRAMYSLNGDSDTMASAVKVGFAAGLVLDVVIVLVVAMLGFFDLRGRNGMRITTWVLAGIGALCLGCGAAAGGATGSLFHDTASANGETISVADLIPTWAKDTETAIDVIAVLALILVIILLALPASNAFFSKAPLMMAYPGGWVAPMQGYPQNPAYPTYPAQGAGPQYPPTSPYPPTYPPTSPASPYQPGSEFPPLPPAGGPQDPTSPPAGPTWS
jgi:hypothetical protein